MLRRHELVFDRDVMAPATIEPCNVPGVLDLPLVGRQQKASNQRRPFFAGRPRHRFSTILHDAEPDQPVGMLATTGEWPPSIDAPTGRRRPGCPTWHGRRGR